jgi:hypothetical protein
MSDPVDWIPDEYANPPFGVTPNPAADQFTWAVTRISAMHAGSFNAVEMWDAQEQLAPIYNVAIAGEKENHPPVNNSTWKGTKVMVAAPGRTTPIPIVVEHIQFATLPRYVYNAEGENQMRLWAKRLIEEVPLNLRRYSWLQVDDLSPGDPIDDKPDTHSQSTGVASVRYVVYSTETGRELSYLFRRYGLEPLLVVGMLARDVPADMRGKAGFRSTDCVS